MVKVNSIRPDVLGSAPSLTPEQDKMQSGSGPSFGQLVQEGIHNLNALQVNANDKMSQLASGQPVELHDVLLAVEEASLSLQLALQVRNKLVESYQEISRMQV